MSEYFKLDVAKHCCRLCVCTVTAVLLFSTMHAQAALVIDLNLDLNAPAETPESVLSTALPTICTSVGAIVNPTEDQLGLSIVCAVIQGSNNQAEVDIALEALSARSTTSITDTTKNMNTGADLSDIGTRLSALRHGMASSSGGLTFKLDGQPVATVMLPQTFNGVARGGGAGDDASDGLFASRLGWFASGNFTDASQSRTATEVGFDGDAQGITAGVDYRFRDDIFAGVALNLSQSDADLDNNAGNLEGNNFNVTLYGTYYIKDQWYLDGTFHFGQGSYDLNRLLQFTVGTTTVSEVASSSTDSDQFGFSVGGGYTFQLPDVYQGTALAGLSYSKADIDGFTESSAGGLGLIVAGQTVENMIINAGAQITRPISVSWGIISPLASLSFLYQLEEGGETVRAHFVNDPSGTSFSYNIGGRDNFYADFSIGASMTYAGGMSSFVQIKSLLLLDDFNETSFNFGFRMEL